MRRLRILPSLRVATRQLSPNLILPVIEKNVWHPSYGSTISSSALAQLPSLTSTHWKDQCSRQGKMRRQSDCRDIYVDPTSDNNSETRVWKCKLLCKLINQNRRTSLLHCNFSTFWFNRIMRACYHRDLTARIQSCEGAMSRCKLKWTRYDKYAIEGSSELRLLSVLRFTIRAEFGDPMAEWHIGSSIVPETFRCLFSHVSCPTPLQHILDTPRSIHHFNTFFHTAHALE